MSRGYSYDEISERSQPAVEAASSATPAKATPSSHAAARPSGGPSGGGLRRYAATIMRGDGSLGEIEFLATDLDNAWTAIRHAAAHQGGAAMTVADLGPEEAV